MDDLDRLLLRFVAEVCRWADECGDSVDAIEAGRAVFGGDELAVAEAAENALHECRRRGWLFVLDNAQVQPTGIGRSELDKLDQ